MFSRGFQIKMLMFRACDNATSMEQVAAKLVAEGDFDINATDDHGNTPLALAAKYGNFPLSKQILGFDGLKADSKNLHERTPLAQAAAWGHTAVVGLLLKHSGWM